MMSIEEKLRRVQVVILPDTTQVLDIELDDLRPKFLMQQQDLYSLIQAQSDKQTYFLRMSVIDSTNEDQTSTEISSYFCGEISFKKVQEEFIQLDLSVMSVQNQRFVVCKMRSLNEELLDNLKQKTLLKEIKSSEKI